MSSKLNPGVFTSNTSEWYTPKKYIDAVLLLFNGVIDLDPCSNSHENPNVPAIKHFTKEDDGLNQDWYGHIFMNPPYGKPIKEWLDKLVLEYEEKGNVTEALALVPNSTETGWYHILGKYPLCAIRGRIQFDSPDNREANSNTKGSTVFYLGENYNQFLSVFGELGLIYIPDPNQKVLRESGEQQTLSQIFERFEREGEACHV